MKILIVAKDVWVQQWTGRLVNEAGLSREQRPDCELRFSLSWKQALADAQASIDRCTIFVWSASLNPREWQSLPTFAGQVVLIRQSATDRPSRFRYSDPTFPVAMAANTLLPNFQVIDEADLTSQTFRDITLQPHLC